ncbi:unnamed protein product [Anisakis simplex]|uniref:EOR-1 (inferred by orthology to a C. elegans protein) n=1 Tax=Anisakis simplex TaxID=6269 RepID=A0A0M3K7E4_ANISI|nr:unnamed protein product [Anisakis simplex]
MVILSTSGGQDVLGNNSSSNVDTSTNLNLNPMSFTDQHGNILLERLRYQREMSRFCDVHLIVKDRQFSAHRNILAACSPYFDSILKNSKVVKEQVTVNCQNPSVFELLLNYMYSGSVVIDRSSVTDLLKLANNFLVSKVKNYCAEYLDRYMDASNCLSVKELALKYNLPALLKSSCDYFDVNINRCLLESHDIVEYSLAQLNQLLYEPKYANTISADVHLKLIVRWVAHNPSHRDSLFKEMLSSCPFAMLQSNTLENLLDYSPFLANSLSSRFALLQLMYEHSVPMAKYEAQYRTLLSQFGGQVNMYFNDNPAQIYSNDNNNSANTDNHSDNNNNQLHYDTSSKVELANESATTSGLHCEDKSIHESKNCIAILPNNDDRSCAQATTSVIDATSTDQLKLNSTTDNSSNNNGNSESNIRPSLKLKIQLNNVNLMNRKNRILGVSSTSSAVSNTAAFPSSFSAYSSQSISPSTNRINKLYRKSISNANQIIAKKRGRPPKPRQSYMNLDVSTTSNNSHNSDVNISGSEHLYPDCAVDFNDEVVFDEEDEIDPLSVPSADSENEENADSAATATADHKCTCCEYRCSKARSLKHHFIRQHTKEIVHVCSLCVFECRWNRDYYTHMKGHFPGPPFQCDLCEYNNDRMQLLLSHRLTHNDERPFKCLLCEYKSRSKTHLVSHINEHTPNKPFHCSECGRGFALKSTLDQHIAAHSQSRTHLAVRAHQCKICNRSFIEKSHLVRHERIHLEDKPFKCDNCDYASSRRDKLKEHIQKHHSNNANGKQHRRRYRRAKQLAQLAAAANAAAHNKVLSQQSTSTATAASAQPSSNANMVTDSMFRPISSTDLLDTTSNPNPLHPAIITDNSNMNNTSQTQFVIRSDINQDNQHISSNQSNQQQQQQIMIDLATINTMNNANANGRPSSAMLPQSSAINLSPTMSLNFQLGGGTTPLLDGRSKDITLGGAIMESPIDCSLRTPLLLTRNSTPPHSVTCMDQQQFNSNNNNGNNDANNNSQDMQRPMSLPSYSAQQQFTNNNNSPWGW